MLRNAAHSDGLGLSPRPVPLSAMNDEIRDPVWSTVVSYSGTQCWTWNPLYSDSDHLRKASGEHK